jgi:hypothetical protein
MKIVTHYRKEKYDKYLEYSDEAIALLTTLDRYQDLENLHLRIYGNHKLTNDRRHSAIMAIFNFPSFYKPKIKLNQSIINDIIALNPESPEND